MSSRSERERLIVIGSGSPLAKHSMNQRAFKSSMDGERRLGIRKQRSTSEFRQMIEELESDELFMFFCNAAASYDREGLPVPTRVGLFARGISSYVNARLKNEAQAFTEEMKEADQFPFDLGSPLEKLIPKEKMVSDFFQRAGIPFRPENLYRVYRGAGIFAYNFGALNFGQGEEIAAVHALMAAHNIAVYLGSDISEQQLPIKDARLMTVTFGETTNRHLRALKPKKITKTSERR